MRKMFFFLVVSVACVLENTSAWNYFWQSNPQPQDLIRYPYLPFYAPIWQPDCDKNKDSSESSESSSSSDSSESKEDNSGESDNKESKESNETKEKSGENNSSEDTKESKEGSKESKEESKESKSSEDSSEDSKEKKEAPKKKKKKKEPKYQFPARFYYPPPVPPATYGTGSYFPYKSSYIVQQPISSYPMKSAYQYGQVGSYPPGTVQRIVYSSKSAYNYAAAPKPALAPGISVISLPQTWRPTSFFKK